MRPFLLLTMFMLIRLVVNAQSSQQQTFLQQEWDTIRMRMHEQQDSLVNLYKICSTRLALTTDTTLKKELEDKLHYLNNAIERNTETALQQEFNLVRRNPSSPIALDILHLEFNRKEGKPYETFYSLFYSLSQKLRNSEKGKILKDALFYCKNSEVGKQAPDFVLKDINQETLSLKMFHNKAYVLLDFWASWCVPCRQDFPFLKDLYQKYSAKGLEVINISRDEDLDKWQKAIEKDRIGEWQHVATKENKIKIESLYFVSAIPVKVLIDKEGRIVGRWRGGGEENKAALKQTLEALLD